MSMLITAYHVIKKGVNELNPSDHAVVIGVGGLGHIGVQCLDAMSTAKITAVDLIDSGLELADSLGLDNTIRL